LHRTQQAVEPLEPIVDGREQCNCVLRGKAPALPSLAALLHPICSHEAAGIDGTADDLDVASRHAIVTGKVVANHGAVDDDDRRPRPQILLLLQRQVRPVGQIELLAEPRSGSQQGIGELVHVVIERRAIQPGLRVQHILSPRLVKAHRYIVLHLLQNFQAGSAELPGPKEANARRTMDPVVLNAARQGAFIPGAGNEMHLMPIAEQAARKIADVRLAPAKRGKNTIVAKCQFHSESSKSGQRSAFSIQLSNVALLAASALAKHGSNL